MQKTTRILWENQHLSRCFLTLPDPRVRGRCKYPLFNILCITLCALICGADTWKAIEKFGHLRYRWLNQFLDLSSGIPSHYTFARVFERINPQELQSVFMSWVMQFTQLLKDDVINIDGKTLCGSSHEGVKKASHIVNAFAARQKITLGCVKTPDKSNEIKGIPLLLKALNPTGCIITIDAMGTQKGIANLIRIKQAEYVLALKKNHKRFYRHVDTLFSKANALQYKAMVFREQGTKDYDHSRIEEREYTILPAMYLPQYKKSWRDLQAFIKVKSTRHLKTHLEESTRYYITSIPFHSIPRV